MTFLTVPLSSSFNKNNFSCGESSLDHYIREQASQDIKRKLAVCFVLPGDNNQVKGFYTLSSESISNGHLPEHLKKKMPRAYERVPVTLLGRLAVDSRFKGKGLGELLLADALKRAWIVSVHQVASMAVVTDPLHSHAASFYKKYGFIQLPGTKRLFLPMKTVEGLFE